MSFLLSSGIPAEIEFLKTASLKTIDRRFEYRGPLNLRDTSKVVIVSIDASTLDELPSGHPFPDWYYVKAIRNLFDLGAIAVGVDVHPKSLLGPRTREAIYATFKGRKTPVVIAVDEPDHQSRSDAQEAGRSGTGFSFDRSGIVGADKLTYDADGVCRRYLLEAPGRGKRPIPSFGFALLTDCLRLSGHSPFNERSYVQLEGIRIPKYDDGSILINFPGPAGREFPIYHFWEVLDDSSFVTRDEMRFGVRINYYYYLRKENVFRNKVVLIGSTLPESQDVERIPFTAGTQNKNGNLANEVEIHASAIETMLDGVFLRPVSPWLNFLEMFLGALAIASVPLLFRPGRGSSMFVVSFVPLATAGVVAAGSYESALVFFAKNGIVMEVVYPLVAFVFSYIGTIAYQFASEQKQKTAIKSLFRRYVDPSLVDHLVENPDVVSLGGERKVLSVLFTDITNFTGLSEQMDPQRLVSHLNQYLSSMTNVVFKNCGTLDKYIGDAIIAFWGAPVEVKGHAHSACTAALQMAERLEELNAVWNSNGLPTLSFRVGINSGEMVVGNIGGTERFEYTVIGDNVNLASRLESANKTYRTRILLSASTYELIKDDMAAREIDLMIVKGKTKPVKVYELISGSFEGLDVVKRDLLALYADGLSKYRERDWKRAAAIFERVLQVDPDDYPSKMYLGRCKMLEVVRPPADWDGVFVIDQ